MPYFLPANPQTLLDIRQLVVSYSGDNSLVQTEARGLPPIDFPWVDNGVDHYINAGMKFLERRYYTPLGSMRDHYTVPAGLVYHTIPRVKVIRSAWFLDSEGARTKLTRKDLHWLREFYSEPFENVDADTPTVYGVEVGGINRMMSPSFASIVPSNVTLNPPTTPGWSIGTAWSAEGDFFKEVNNAAIDILKLVLLEADAFHISITFSEMTAMHKIVTACDPAGGGPGVGPHRTKILEDIPGPGTYTYSFQPTSPSDWVSLSIYPYAISPPASCVITDFSITPASFDPHASLGLDQTGFNLILMPPTNTAGTVEIYGDFFSPSMGSHDEEGENWWTVNAPLALTFAALYQREISRRQIDAANEWLRALELELQSIRQDANENFGPELGDLIMEIC